ncbi:CAP domain-containing protein [Sphingomonas sp. ID0503]|uniref:CAP domain-containing protein n=1 Tax=Sphingomonas sp. ID0503 TaxID=3399691 RepID=UPI003AFB38C5
MFKRLLPILALALLSPALQATHQPLSIEARLLAAHNRERTELGLPPLVWDKELAAGAAEWAKHLTRVGRLIHSPDDPSDADPPGENLWAGTRGYYGPEDMVGLWAAEKKNFKPGAFPTNSRTGELEDVGHYTQLVWRSSRQVGCAIAHGQQDDFLVCRYAEGGNVIGETPY